ncbi:MAG: hypothetical protein IJ925_04990, partial [Muribaculaceae bacterium]|nr:hypothetical protein [Muribaculaceae bacterium]
MKRYIFILLLLIGVSLCGFSQDRDARHVAGDTVLRVDYGDGYYPTGSLENRKAYLKHIRDSIDAIPFDTTRDNDYRRRAIVNGKWS